jgi:hypothetical protein
MKSIEVSAATCPYTGADVVELCLEGNFLENDVYRNLTPKEARDLAAELLTAANQIDWIRMANDFIERKSNETD